MALAAREDLEHLVECIKTSLSTLNRLAFETANLTLFEQSRESL